MNIPLIAYGTWIDPMGYEPPSSMITRVATAIQIGYTHFDTAWSYGSEKYLIQAIVESGYPRDTFFITSKIARLQSLPTLNQLQSAVKEIQYYDLLLLHGPPLDTESRDDFKQKIFHLWGGMVDFVKAGLVKMIGVSNFYRNQIDLLLEVCLENNLPYPVVNQIEIHPGNLELSYVPYLQSKNIIPFAHTPLGGILSKFVLNNEILIQIANRLHITPAEVVLAYLLKRGIGIITTSRDPNRMSRSLHVATIIPKLTDMDMIQLNTLESDGGPLGELQQASYHDNIHLHRW